MYKEKIMKKLLFTGLALASLSVLNTFAQPATREATFYTNESTITKDLKPFVTGGTRPYSFVVNESQNVHRIDDQLGRLIFEVQDHKGNKSGYLSITPNGEFIFGGFPGAWETSTFSFTYSATDANGLTSQPATVTIIVGQEKG